VRQYQHLFSLENAALEFTDAALDALADRALARQTGARALRAVLDEVMLDLMYDLPDRDRSTGDYVIDACHLEGPIKLEDLVQRRAESA
jgi:ATP-dependent Clp protease ATP-binding subunit ClpX